MKHFIVFVLICLISKQDSYAQTIKLNARITDVDTMLVIIRGLDWADTLMTSNGIVSYEKSIGHHEMIHIIFVKNNQSMNAIREGNERKMRSKSDGVFRQIFSDDNPVVFTSNFSGIANLVLKSSEGSNQYQYNQFRKRFDPLVKIARTIIDSSSGKSNTESGSVHNMLYKRVLEIEEEVAAQFVKDYANTIAGAYVLYRYCRIEDAGKLNALYQLFNDDLKKSGYLMNIREKVLSLQALIPGKPAPDFRVKSMEGYNLSLDSLKGKYIVLDFWGSWCEPCISGFPEMKTYQAKYKDKCTFLGIACKDDYETWKRALNKYNLGWLQVLNPEGDADLTIKYNVESFPTKIVLDQSGAFVARFIEESAEFYRYLDAIFSRN